MNTKNLAYAMASVLGIGLLVWAAWPEAQQVEIARLSQGDFVRELVEDAQTRVRERFTVSAPLTGQLLRPQLQAGDTVTAGQVLAEILPAPSVLLDPRTQGEQRERVAAMQATLDRTQANHARAMAAEQQAQTDLQRTQSLAARHFVSATQLESAQLALQQRQQERVMAEQERRSAEHDLQRLRIGLSQPASQRMGPRLALPSPGSGRVLKLHRDSEGPIAAGAAILDIGDPGQLEVVTELLTTDAASLPAQAPATLGHWGGGEGVLHARLSRVEPGAFTKVSALGVEEQRVKAIFHWLDAPPAGLGDGFKMEIRITLQRAQSVPLVPVSTVFPHGQSHAVFVVDRGRARLHPVQLLGRNGQQAWLRTDLPTGTVLVAYPSTTLRAGDRVQPIQP